MSTAELERFVGDSARSEEELADDLYAAVKAALARGEQRDVVYAALQDIYRRLSGDQWERQRRAVREVLGCFYGYSAPSSAL